MSTQINSFVLPANFAPTAGGTGYNYQQTNVLFMTIEGLLGVYVKKNAAAAVINQVALFNPATDTGMTGPAATNVAVWTTSSSWAGAGYSATHKGMIGIPYGQGAPTNATLKNMDLKTGIESNIGVINLSATGINDSQADQCQGLAFDGTYLHYLKGSAGVVYVMEIVTGTVIRTYNAPFGSNTTSISYDNNGYMYFGSNNTQLVHVAKVQIPTTGSGQQNAPIVGVWKIANFNDSSQANLYNKDTMAAWDGRNMLLMRRGYQGVWRYDMTNDASIAIISPSPGRIATSANATITVRVLDDVGQIVTGVSVDLAINNSGGPVYGTVSPTTAVTNANGDATFTYTAGATAGTDNLTATVRY